MPRPHASVSIRSRIRSASRIASASYALILAGAELCPMKFSGRSASTRASEIRSSMRCSRRCNRRMANSAARQRS